MELVPKVPSERVAQGLQWAAGGFIPGLGAVFRGLTRVLPLRRGTVVERDGCLYVR